MSTPAAIQRADLHVHSRFSDSPTNAGIRALRSAESYTDPRELYAYARARGMDFVTITDHNTLAGALSIADLPGTFLSAEFDTWFPENGSRVHVVAAGIDEPTFAAALKVRESIYDLVACLRESGTVHYIAHPLFDMTGRLDVDTVEKLLLLFNTLEGRNGARSVRCNGLLRAIASALTPQDIDDMAERQGIEPYGPEPWRKALVGGSDDHSGLFIAGAHTAAAGDGTVEGFLAAVARGDCETGGEDGDARILAHSIYATSFWRLREILKLDEDQPRRRALKLLRQGFGRIGRDVPLLEKTVRGARSVAPGLYRDGDPRGPAWEATLEREIGGLLASPGGIAGVGSKELNRRIFDVVRPIADDALSLHLPTLLGPDVPPGAKRRLQSAFAVGMVHFLEIPYFFAWGFQSRDRTAQEDLREHFLGERRHTARERVAVLTDTDAGAPAVELGLATLTRGHDTSASEFEVITSLADPAGRNGSTDFPPLAWRSAAGSATRHDADRPEPLVWPPVVDIVDYLEENEFTAVHACTPGPMGLLAAVAAWLLHIPATASTPAAPPPASAREERYTTWFYGRFDQVTAGSRAAARGLVSRGLDPRRVRVAPAERAANAARQGSTPG